MEKKEELEKRGKKDFPSSPFTWKIIGIGREKAFSFLLRFKCQLEHGARKFALEDTFSYFPKIVSLFSLGRKWSQKRTNDCEMLEEERSSKRSKRRGKSLPALSFLFCEEAREMSIC